MDEANVTDVLTQFHKVREAHEALREELEKRGSMHIRNRLMDQVDEDYEYESESE
jgi:hypothetical protein